VVLGGGFHLLAEVLEGLVELLPHALLLLLLLELVRVVLPRPVLVEVLGRFHHVGVELHVDRPLFPDHHRVPQVEVHQDHHLVLARLEHGVLDVVVNELERLALAGAEQGAVLVHLEGPGRLAARHGGPHHQVVQARHAVAELHQPHLLDEAALLLLLPLPLPVLLPQVLDLAERGVELLVLERPVPAGERER
jgi:hypothetical protein